MGSRALVSRLTKLAGWLLVAMAAALALRVAYAGVIFRYDFSKEMLDEAWETVAQAPEIEFSRIGSYLQLKGKLKAKQNYFFALKEPLDPSRRYQASVQISFAAIPKRLPVPLDSAEAPAAPAVASAEREWPLQRPAWADAQPPLLLFGILDKSKQSLRGAMFRIYPLEVQIFSNAHLSGATKEEPLRQKVGEVAESGWNTFGLTYDAPDKELTFALDGKVVGETTTEGLGDAFLFFGLSGGEGENAKQVTFARWKDLRLEAD